MPAVLCCCYTPCPCRNSCSRSHHGGRPSVSHTISTLSFSVASAVRNLCRPIRTLTRRAAAVGSQGSRHHHLPEEPDWQLPFRSSVASDIKFCAASIREKTGFSTACRAGGAPLLRAPRSRAVCTVASDGPPPESTSPSPPLWAGEL